MLREAFSTARRRFRRRSGSTPHDNLTATTPKSRSPVRSLLSRPRLSSFQPCVHHATATPIFRNTPARRPEKRLAPELQRHHHLSPHLAADLSCGPHAVQIPITERAAPPNPYPSPRFRALALFGRRPSRRVDSLSSRRPKTCTKPDQTAFPISTTLRFPCSPSK